MVSQIAGGTGVLQDVLNAAGGASNDLLRAADLTGWVRPSLIGAASDSFLPTLSREAQQTQQAAAMASAANAARSNDISAYSAQAQNRLGELNLLAGLRGPTDAIKYNYMLNRIAPPAGTQAQGSYLQPLAPAGNPLSGFSAAATPGSLAASAPKMAPNMGIPNTPAAVKPTVPPAAIPAASAAPGAGGVGSSVGLPPYLSPQGDPQSPAAQERFQQGLQDGSINIQTQEEDVAAHQQDLQEAAQQFQEEHGRAPENWETIAQEYENRGYDIPGFAMGSIGLAGGPVRDPLALVGDEKGGKPELLVNHGDGSFDILNNKMTQHLLDSGMIDKMDMSEYKNGTRRSVSFKMGRRRFNPDAVLDPSQIDDRRGDKPPRRGLGGQGLGGVPSYADGTVSQSLIPGVTGASSAAGGTGWLANTQAPVQSLTPATAGQAPGSSFSTNTSGQRPYTPVTSPEQALGNTVYNQQAIANLPAIQKLTGRMQSRGAWNPGIDTRIPGTDTALPFAFNTVNFMRGLPTERGLVQSVYETPTEMGGLGIDWADVVEMSRRTNPSGSGLQTMATYGR